MTMVHASNREAEPHQRSRFTAVAHLVTAFGTTRPRPAASAYNRKSSDDANKDSESNTAAPESRQARGALDGKISSGGRSHGDATASSANSGGSSRSHGSEGDPRGIPVGGIAGELITTLLMTVQSASVWMSAMPVPAGYLLKFQSPFAAFSIDITSIMHTNPVVTPLVQLFAGFVVFGVLFYFIESDEQAFLANMARYVVRRDSLDVVAAPLEQSTRTAAVFDVVADAVAEDGYGEVRHNGKLFAVPLLPLAQSQRIDAFLGRASKTAANSSIAKERQLVVHDLQNVEYTLIKPVTIKQTKSYECSELEVRSDETETSALRVVGHECPLHRGRALGKQLQSDVWPFRFRPSCCVEIGGRRCNASVGNMFVCGHVDVASQEQSQCLYALCERHFRAPLEHELIAPLIAIYRATVRRGTVWAVVALFLLLANAAYTPLMKTALMILACDPSYQCEFQTCWNNPDRQFTLAAYLCIVIATFYGLGFPIGLASLLRRRSKMLHCIFFAPEYRGRYVNREGTLVKLNEWRRFVYTDPTALGKLYATFELEWIYVPPIMLFWKAALLLPAIFIERGTFGQMVGIATVQFLVGLFLFITEPSISPLVDMLYKLGGGHQMLLLGLLALNRRQQYVGGTKLDNACIALTSTYLVICILATVIDSVLPVVRGHLELRRVGKVLVTLGMQYSGTTGLYVVPSQKEPWVDAPDDLEEADAPRKAAGIPESKLPVDVVMVVVNSKPDVSNVNEWSDGDVDEPIPSHGEQTSFAALGLSEALQRGLEEATFYRPIGIQPLVLQTMNNHPDSDLSLVGSVSSGMTTALAVAMLRDLNVDRKVVQRVIVAKNPRTAERIFDLLLVLSRHVSSNRGAMQWAMLSTENSSLIQDAQRLRDDGPVLLVTTIRRVFDLVVPPGPSKPAAVNAKSLALLALDDVDGMSAVSRAYALIVLFAPTARLVISGSQSLPTQITRELKNGFEISRQAGSLFVMRSISGPRCETATVSVEADVPRDVNSLEIDLGDVDGRELTAHHLESNFSSRTALTAQQASSSSTAGHRAPPPLVCAAAAEPSAAFVCSTDPVIGLDSRLDEMPLVLASDPLMAHWRRAAVAVTLAQRGRNIVLVHPGLEFWTPALVLVALQTALEGPPQSRAACSPSVIIVAAAAEDAAAFYKTARTMLTTLLDNAITVDLFTDAVKFSDDVERLNGSSPPTIVVGTLRRITDLVRRGVLQIAALCRLVIPCCEDIASIPSDLERLRTLLQFVDLRSTPIVATCTEEEQRAIQPAIASLASDWIWMKSP